MLRPVLGESFEHCRDFHFDMIHTCQDLIATIRKHVLPTAGPETKTLAKEVIQQNLDIIKNTYAELKEMQRWWNSEGKNEGK